MERDLDLIGEILSLAHNNSENGIPTDPSEIDAEHALIDAHVDLLCAEGLLLVGGIDTLHGPEKKAMTLTLNGLRFLDIYRDGAKWEKLKEGAKTEGEAIPLTLLFDYAHD